MYTEVLTCILICMYEKYNLYGITCDQCPRSQIILSIYTSSLNSFSGNLFAYSFYYIVNIKDSYFSSKSRDTVNQNIKSFGRIFLHLEKVMNLLYSSSCRNSILFSSRSFILLFFLDSYLATYFSSKKLSVLKINLLAKKTRAAHIV